MSPIRRAPSRQNRHTLLTLACTPLFALALFPATPLHADAVWTATTSGQWSTATNWSTNPLIPNGQDQNVLFSNSTLANTTVGLSIPITVGGITFDSPFAYTIIASPANLTLSTSTGNATITVNHSFANVANTLSTPILLASPTIITNNDLPTTAALTLSGALSGSAPLTLNGPGQVTLSGNNSAYTGPITINNGTLAASSATALGSSTSAADGTTINSGGTLTINTPSAVIKEFVTLNGGTLQLSASPLTFSNSLSVTADSNITAFNLATSTFNTLLGASNLTFATGAFTLAGKGAASTFSGNVVLTSTAGINLTGSLVNAQSITVNHGTLLTLALPVGTDPTLNSVTPGSVIANNAEVGVSADIDFRSALSASATLSGILFNTANATLGGSNSLDMNMFNNPSAIRIGGTGSIAATMDLRPDLATHTLRLGLPDIVGTVMGTPIYASNLAVNASLVDHDGSPETIDVNGGTVTLSANNTYSGITTIANGNLLITNPNALGTASGTDADGTIVNANGTLYLGSNITLTNEKITVNPGGTLTAINTTGIYANPITMNGGTLGNGTYTGTLSGSGNFSVVFATLSGVGVYTGNLTFTGNSTISGPSALNPAANAFLALGNLTVTQPILAPLQVSNGTLFLAANVMLTTNTITITGGTLSAADTTAVYDNPIVVNGPAALGTGTFAGQISGNSNITLTGIAHLNGDDTYSGTTTVVSGANVTVNSLTGLGSLTSGTFVAGGLLTMAAASQEPITVSGGNFTVTGGYDGPLTLSTGNANISAPSSFPILMKGGNLNINSNFSGPVIMNNGNLTISAGASANISMAAGLMSLFAPGSSAITATGGIIDFRYSNGTYTGSLSLSNTTLGFFLNQGTAFSSPFIVSGNTVFSGNLSSTQVLQVPSLSGSGNLTSNLPMSISGGVNFSGILTENTIAQSNTTFTNITSSGIISLNGTGNTTITSSINHNGTLYMHGGGLAVNGTASHISTMTISGNSNLSINGNVVVDHLILDTSTTFPANGLFGNGTLSLSEGQLEIASGYLDFTGSAPGLSHIDKISQGVAAIEALPSGFTGPINVESGLLQVEATLGSSSSPISLMAANTSVEFDGMSPAKPGSNGTYSNPIFLNSRNLNGSGLLIDGNPFPVTLTGPIDLGTAGNVFGEFSSTVGGALTVTGTITGGPLTVDPDISLTLTAPSNSFAGLTVIGGTTSCTVDLQSVLTSNAPINLEYASILIIDNKNSAVSNRIPDAAPINLQSAWLVMQGKQGAGVVTSETLGNVSLQSGTSLMTVTGASIGIANVAQLNLSSLQRSAGAVLDFEDSSNTGNPAPPLGATSDGSHIFIAGQAITSFLGGAYTSDRFVGSGIGAANFVKYTSQGVTALTPSDYFTGGESLWDSTLIPNLSDATNVTLTASRSVLAMKASLPPYPASPVGVIVNLAGNVLNVLSGGWIVQNNSVVTGTAGNHLTAGGSASSAELFFHSGLGITTIAANITDNPGLDGLYDPVPGGPLDADNGQLSVTFSGEGYFKVSGINTYTGTTYINDPLLSNTQRGVAFASSASISGGPIIITGGNLVLDGNFAAHTGPITLTLGNITGNGTLNASSYALNAGTISVPLFGNGTLTKTGDGNLTMSNLAAFTGSILVLGGNVTVPVQTYSNAIIVQQATLGISTGLNGNVTFTGPLTLGNNSVLNLTNFPTLVLKPSQFTVGNNATIAIENSFYVSGLNDPFTDSSNPSRHVNLTLTASPTLGGPVTFDVEAGSKNIAALTASITVVDSGASLTADSVLAATAITLNGTLTIRSNDSGPSETGNLTLAGSPNAWTSTLDITDRSLIVEPSGTNKANVTAQLLNQIAFGRNGGNWLGKGITSSAAAADPTHYGVALLDNANLQLLSFAGGVGNVDENSLIIAYELLGDANADGTVDLNDLNTVLNNLGSPTSAWTSGNFDGQPTIDLTDLNDVLNNLGTTFTNPGAALPTPTPEPASLALLLAGTAGVIARRRKA